MAHGSWEGARLSEPIPSSSRAEDLTLAVTVARRYFVDDRTKVEIAAELKLSRFKVARLLDLARDSGLVRISIGTPGGVDVELSDQLRRHLGLSRAIVVNAVDGGDAEIRAVAHVEVARPAERGEPEADPARPAIAGAGGKR